LVVDAAPFDFAQGPPFSLAQVTQAGR